MKDFPNEPVPPVTRIDLPSSSGLGTVIGATAILRCGSGPAPRLLRGRRTGTKRPLARQPCGTGRRSGRRTDDARAAQNREAAGGGEVGREGTRSRSYLWYAKQGSL